jgi:hypothetical protein
MLESCILFFFEVTSNARLSFSPECFSHRNKSHTDIITFVQICETMSLALREEHRL